MEQPWDEMSEVQRKLEFARMRIALQQAEDAQFPFRQRVGSRVPTANNSPRMRSHSPARAQSPSPSHVASDAHNIKNYYKT